MKPGNNVFEQTGVGAGGVWGGKTHSCFLWHGLEMLNAFFAFCLFVTLGQKKGNTKPNQTPNQPKARQTEQMEQFHYFSHYLLPKCFGHSLVDEEWWNLPLLEEFSSHQNWDLSAQEKVISAVPESSLSLPSHTSQVGKCGVLSGCSAEELLLPLFFKEPPWNVFMLREKWAYNFPELLASFQESIVLCVNSFWGWCVIIAALGRMGGKEIPLSLRSCEVFFCSLELEASVGFGAEGSSLYPWWGQDCLLPSRKCWGAAGVHLLC